MPGTDLAGIEAFYVRDPSSEDSETELHGLIVQELVDRGYKIQSLRAASEFEAGEATFQYKADWHWDITPYLLELRVGVYDPSDNTLIAQAQSLQTSLVRKDNETVVKQVIAELFDDHQ